MVAPEPDGKSDAARLWEEKHSRTIKKLKEIAMKVVVAAPKRKLGIN